MAEPTTVYPGDRRFAYLALAPSVALVLMLIAVPTVAIFALAVQDVPLGRYSGDFVGLANFRRLFADADFYAALGNTFIWIGGSVGLEMLFGTGLALLLNQRFPLRWLARTILLAPYLLPTIVAVLVWRYMFDDIVGIVNHIAISAGLVARPIQWLTSPRVALLSVILIGVWKFTPFVVIAILGILQSIPGEQYDAAKLDGAGPVRRFVTITLPHILPVFVLTALLRTIWTAHKFDLIYLLTGGGPINATTTLPVLVYVRGFHDFDAGGASAIALVILLLIALLLVPYLLIHRWSEARQ